MKDFRLNPEPRCRVAVRNEWRRAVSDKARPDHVLLDVGIQRDGAWQRDGIEWNCASLTPREARAIAAALVQGANEADGTKRRPTP